MIEGTHIIEFSFEISGRDIDAMLKGRNNPFNIQRIFILRCQSLSNNFLQRRYKDVNVYLDLLLLFLFFDESATSVSRWLTRRHLLGGGAT